jgi:hypothetical protein
LQYRLSNLSQFEEIDLIEKLFFDSYRLERFLILTLAEPVFRDADLVSLDLTMKSADWVILFRLRQMVLTGKRYVLLSRYAGISDKVSIFRFNHNNSSKNPVFYSTDNLVFY